jgi:hypothetical protein
MGLGAVVFRKRDHLQLGPDAERARVVPETGEVYFDDDKLARKYDHQLKAAAHRLGNIALISTLRDEVPQLIGPESVLERKILYSGTHGGDTLPLQELDKLSAELYRIRETGRPSAYMWDLVSALEQLIQAAKDEGHPIVFV